MKKALIAAAAVAVLSTSANASGYVPAVPQEVVVVDTASSNQGIFVPAFALVLFILATHH
ncbi:hypothetical protein K3728_10530 [Rhodobacteraceae bacterium M385]|nr:hypothetical protein K3728_10530 [Rhodobacteraceae bacterium M385]